MTNCLGDHASTSPPLGRPTPGLVLVGLIGADGLPPLEAAAMALSRRLELPLRPLRPLDDPPQALGALWHPGPSSKAGSGWLAALTQDVGLPLDAGGSWAAHLGDWRQPCLLVVTAAQLDSGLPAAGTALLHSLGVPLAGLLQLDGRWDGAARRRDGLPWIGMLLLEGKEDADPSAVEAESVAEAVAEGEAVAWRVQTLLRCQRTLGNGITG